MSDTKLHNRCMGECCEDIGVRLSPEEIKASYFYWLSKEKNAGSYKLSKSTSLLLDSNHKIYEDIHLIYPMLVFVKKDYYHPENPTKKSKDAVYHYTCKHFNTENRKCSIYDIRPAMCRSYPDGKACRNPKCKWKKQIALRKKEDKLKVKQERSINNGSGKKRIT